VRAPPGAGAGAVHLVPQSAQYAYGLLLRDGPGDAARATRCLEALLELQYDEPGAVWHGTFARFAETEHPPDGAVAWVHYDPNWRQFLGTTLLALLQDFESALPARLVRRVEAALRLAVAGEPPGRVPAAYSNIALMKAWLEVEAGVRLGERAWVRWGEDLADEVARRFAVHGAFEEYNSPTYYGIDLHALALWRARSSSSRLRAAGARLEAALWRDVARWYHARLRNLCGPYSRTYGMDMTRYVALLGLQLWVALGRERAPLPTLAPEVEHGHDLFLGPLAAVDATCVPDEARAALARFPGEHRVRQTVATQPARTATGWLANDAMIGAERSESDAFSAWSQYVASTVHWRLPDGGVGWVVVRTLGPPQAEAQPGALLVDWPPSEPGGDRRISLHAPGVEPSALRTALSGAHWDLPGLRVSVESDALGPEVAPGPAGATLVYRRRGPGRAARLVLRVEPTG
jgi:hypothetical protein